MSVGTNACVWSAVSNASWLTITSGVSGTGAGSFTLTAAAATNYSLSTSYTYDTINFWSPAFTAYPSGNSLTGERTE